MKARRREAVGRMQRRLSALMHAPDSPEKFRAIAKWWSLEAIISASPGPHIRAAMAHLFIAADMENRPGYHGRKPLDQTRWQWSQAL